MNAVIASFVILFGASATLVHAAEIGFVSGLFKSEKTKNSGTDGGGKTLVEVGGRYGDAWSDEIHWFGQALLGLRSYDPPSGGKAPSNSTSLTLVGGGRYYFLEFSDSVLPYVSGSGGYLTDKDATATVETEVSGLFYFGHAGFRFNADREVVFDLETQLFKSALFATEKEETIATGAKVEKTRTELYVNTTGTFFAATYLSVGYRF